MAKREVIDCDICKEKNVKEAQTITFETGQSKFDGNEREYETISRDLCPKCLASFIKFALTFSTSTDVQKFTRGWLTKT